ncbi:L,D-transpeptidase [Consotaella sp. CSK11QG-6]
MAGPAAAQDGARPPVKVSPEIAGEWLLQLSPGSGVVPGYRRKPVVEHRVDRNGVVYSAGDSSFPITIDPRATALFAAPPRQAPAARPAVQSRAPAVSRAPGVPAPARQAALTTPRTVQKAAGFDPIYAPQTVDYQTSEAPGTIVIDTEAKFLYHVMAGGQARRYGVGVGKPGFEWAGTHSVSAKRQWPDWRPPAQMIAREKKRGRILPVVMKGGPDNPLGARALYLGSTLYRIHGTNQPWSIGKAVSSGCIRMRNEDVIELYDQVAVGTRVIVR